MAIDMLSGVGARMSVLQKHSPTCFSALESLRHAIVPANYFANLTESSTLNALSHVQPKPVTNVLPAGALPKLVDFV